MATSCETWDNYQYGDLSLHKLYYSFPDATTLYKDKRKDGFLFSHYNISAPIKEDGTFREVWMSPKSFKKTYTYKLNNPSKKGKKKN